MRVKASLVIGSLGFGPERQDTASLPLLREYRMAW